MTPNYNDVLNLFKNNEISGFIAGGKKYRLFTSNNGVVCYFLKNSSTKGLPLYEYHLENFEKFIEIKNYDAWNLIRKYYNEAQKSTLNNDFINRCKNLPSTREQWVRDGSKSLYEYSITTGNKIDGNVITLDTINNKYHYIKRDLLNAITENKEYRTYIDFRNTETVISFNPKYGYTHLVMYYKSGKEYTYILINEDKFIGVDVD